MQFSSHNHRRETHREYLERLEMLADREFAPASQRAIWNLADNLRLIDEAERLLARGYLSELERYRVRAALGDRTPEKAREAAQFYFQRDYSAAVSAERLAA